MLDIGVDKTPKIRGTLSKTTSQGLISEEQVFFS